jgi:CHAD domain-containing protein
MADGKWIDGLTPQMSVSLAAKEVLESRFQIVGHYLPLAVEKPSEDPEYIHQLRVGTRRAGAALRVFADCVPRKHLKVIRQSLKLIRRAAGDARDWDVFLLSLPAAKSLASDAGKPALDFLIGYAMGERSAAQVRLANASHEVSAAFDSECTNLGEYLHEPKGEAAPASFGDLAAAHLATLLSSFTVAAEANPTNPSELHQLRILGKRVRYALEIFASCFPSTYRESVYPAVESVQEILGDVQDAAVGLSRLSALRDRMKLVVPAEWPRLRKGFEGLMQSMRAKVPAGRKAFQKWRSGWQELVDEMKLEVAVTSVTA